MTTFVNDKPLEHISSNLTRFFANRCDLRDGVKVEKSENLSEAFFAQDVAEFAAWHRGCIFDQLNGFQGYDCIRFDIQLID